MRANKVLKNSAIFATLFLLILAYGCGPSSKSTTNYRTGTKGVEINFAESSPPESLHYSQGGDNRVAVSIEVRNLGAESCDGATIYLSGYDPNILPLPSTVSVKRLEGKEESKNPSGSLEYVEVGNFEFRMPSGVDFIEIPLMATACYKYKTIAGTTVCIDPNPSKPGTKACKPARSISMSGGQGGPVSVTSIQQESGVGNVIFTFTIKNVGGGEVISSDSTGTCMSADLSKQNLVKVSGSLSDRQMSCTPSDVRLVNGEGIVVCKVSGLSSSQSAYTTNVQLTLEYGYKYSTVKNVKLIRL
ncbi:MAG: hypothetical protein QXW00_02315 [Candidatus Woesearchaeota archaeon]